jgi:antitoxin component YwqK of YwqJK toxin-antitoxin module
MKYIIILAFIVTAVTGIHAQQQLKTDTINQKLQGKKEGYWIKYRTNKKIEWEGYFKKGEKTGFWKIYDKEKAVHVEGELINGKRIGSWYVVDTDKNVKLDRTDWDGKGHCVGGATLSW